MGKVNKKPIKRSFDLSNPTKMNANMRNVEVFVDTTTLYSGFIVYDIEEIPTLKEKPYVTFKPVQRVITGVHSTGVDRGVIFSIKTFVPKTNGSFNQKFELAAEDDRLYSPLTKDQALYICKILNLQARQTYQHHLKMRSLRMQRGK